MRHLLGLAMLIALAIPGFAQHQRAKGKPAVEADPTFHGIKLGRPISQSMPACKENETLDRCYQFLAAGVRIVAVLYAGEYLLHFNESVTLFGDDNTVQAVAMTYNWRERPGSTEGTLEGLTKKFGQPACKNPENGIYGSATNASRVCEWTSKWGTIVLIDLGEKATVRADMNDAAHQAIKFKTGKDEF